MNITTYFTAIVLTILIFISCDADESRIISFQEPRACIEVPSSLHKVAEEITFNNCSEHSTHFLWDFGDGTITTETNPTHTYWTEGEYTVELLSGLDLNGDGILNLSDDPNSTSSVVVIANSSNSIELSIFDAQSWASDNTELDALKRAKVKLFKDQSALNDDLPAYSSFSDDNGQVVFHNLEAVDYLMRVQKEGLTNIFNEYLIDGVFQTQEDIDQSATQSGAAIGGIKFADINGDGIIDDSDKTNATLIEKENLSVDQALIQDVFIAQGEASLEWRKWYLSVPLDNGEGKATSIFYEDVLSNNLTSEESEYFYPSGDGSYTMYTKFTGFTTSGTYEINQGKYCRTELREFWQGVQSTDENWLMDENTHGLESTLSVDYCGGNGSTIIAQIHGKESAGIEGNPATVKVFWSNGDIKVFHYTTPDEGLPWTNSFENRDINLGSVGTQVFTIKLKVENGRLYYGLVCEAKNISIDYTFAFDYASNGYVHHNYFKTGNYFVYSRDLTETAQVQLHNALTYHY